MFYASLIDQALRIAEATGSRSKCSL